MAAQRARSLAAATAKHVDTLAAGARLLATTVATELDKEPVHLAKGSGIAVRVEHRGGGLRVGHVHRLDLVYATGLEAHHPHAVLLGGHNESIN